MHTTISFLCTIYTVCSAGAHKAIICFNSLQSSASRQTDDRSSPASCHLYASTFLPTNIDSFIPPTPVERSKSINVSNLNSKHDPRQSSKRVRNLWRVNQSTLLSWVFLHSVSLFSLSVYTQFSPCTSSSSYSPGKFPLGYLVSVNCL